MNIRGNSCYKSGRSDFLSVSRIEGVHLGPPSISSWGPGYHALIRCDWLTEFPYQVEKHL